jgi:hypothetical protein
MSSRPHTTASESGTDAGREAEVEVEEGLGLGLRVGSGAVVLV